MIAKVFSLSHFLVVGMNQILNQLIPSPYGKFLHPPYKKFNTDSEGMIDGKSDFQPVFIHSHLENENPNESPSIPGLVSAYRFVSIGKSHTRNNH